MKIAGLSLVYNEESLVKGCVKSLENFVDKHIMLVSEKPYFGDAEEADKSEEIARDLGCDVIRGTWELDHHQRNTGISILQGYDWIITTDVDMWITIENMAKLLNRLEDTTSDAFIIKQRAYWKDTDHVLVGDDFKPVIAIRPSVRFSHIGNIDTPFEVIDDIVIDHLNWCAPKDILKKVKTYSHAPEFECDIDKWYEEKYLGWKEGEKAEMPDGKCFETSYSPLLPELKEYLK